MHGRLKVRTTEEEKIRKKKEQEIKVKAYRAGMSKIHSKRAKGELDLELYELTSKLLISNPDLNTLWNVRRESILCLAAASDENQALFGRDLDFTEQCLRVQPKSYSAWHHRCWVLENCAVPDWNKEVALCSQYLKLDERNFHCWDYRRYVVEKAGVPAADELQFCTEKIEKNFSNYSSWHYRSKLLPTLYPHPVERSRPISEDKLKEELILVLHAAFTEPNDSSAWFYQRWLLGYSQPELDLAVFKVTVGGDVCVAFTLPVALNAAKHFHGTTFDDQLTSSVWQSASGEAYDTVWTLKLAKDLQLKVGTLELQLDANNLELPLQQGDDCLVGIKTPRFGYEFQAAVLDVLKSQLTDCQELLELEPDSKWTLLTAALLMRAINCKDEDYHRQTLDILQKLQKLDHLRSNYYQDLASKWNIEMQLRKWIMNGATGQLNLSSLSLTALYYEQYMCIAEDVDLSQNQLGNRALARLRSLQSCKRLDLSENPITTLKTFPSLPQLKQICVQGGAIPVEELDAFQGVEVVKTS